jgi:hypothetical protein
VLDGIHNTLVTNLGGEAVEMSTKQFCVWDESAGSQPSVVLPTCVCMCSFRLASRRRNVALIREVTYSAQVY